MKTKQQLNADTLFAFQMALDGHKQFEFLHAGIWSRTEDVHSGFPHRIYHDIPEGWTRHDGEDWKGDKDAVIEEAMMYDGRVSLNKNQPAAWWGGLLCNNFTAENHSVRIYAYKLAAKSPAIPAGFTAHSGGGCPVALDAKIDYILRDGWKGNTKTAGNLFWQTMNISADFIAYRVIEKKVIPWTFADAPAFARVMRKETAVEYVVAFFPDGVRLSRSCQPGHRIESYETLAADYLQLNNSPCGKEVDESCTCASGSLGATQCKIHNGEAK